MSRKILSWVLVALTTSIAMLVGGLSLVPVSAAAPNDYTFTVYSCQPGGRTPVTAFVTNNGNTPIEHFGVLTDRVADGDADGFNETYNIMPGETRPMPLDDEGGLRPGTHHLYFFLYDPDQTVDTQEVRIPLVNGCSTEGLPPGDPMLGGSGGGHTDRKFAPKGLVHLANCQTGLIKGYTSTKGVLPQGGKTTFRYRVGRAKPIVFKMLNGVKKRKVKIFPNVPNRGMVILSYKKGGKWVFLSKDGNVGCGGSRL